MQGPGRLTAVTKTLRGLAHSSTDVSRPVGEGPGSFRLVTPPSYVSSVLAIHQRTEDAWQEDMTSLGGSDGLGPGDALITPTHIPRART